MNGMASALWESGWSDDGFDGTWEWLIDPAYIVAQSNPYYCSGDGIWATGITGWRQRPDPNGPETVTDLSKGKFSEFQWPGCVYIDHCSSVTFGILVGGDDQQLKTVLNLYFW
jgi:hypothetical protein